ncbi:hypothetical protein DFH29DRAFT_156387 [Suillus ampliporus]|nr:hypothetical protein DFH29DRAFT_156387 [Suillus ampliporus]
MPCTKMARGKRSQRGARASASTSFSRTKALVVIPRTPALEPQNLSFRCPYCLCSVAPSLLHLAVHSPFALPFAITSTHLFLAVNRSLPPRLLYPFPLSIPLYPIPAFIVHILLITPLLYSRTAPVPQRGTFPAYHVSWRETASSPVTPTDANGDGSPVTHSHTR